MSEVLGGYDDTITYPDTHGRGALCVWKDGDVYVEYTDDIEFARSWAQANEVELPICEEIGGDWDILPEGIKQIGAFVAKRFKSANVVDVEVSEGHDYGWYTVSGYVGTHLTEEEAIAKGWDLIAFMANVTDPGTFGHPYLWSEISHTAKA